MSNSSVADTEKAMENPHDIEKQEEAKLQARFPQVAKPMAGHSAFLQKRLAKGQKYFDSGDYQMAKQTGKPKPRTMPPILSADVRKPFIKEDLATHGEETSPKRGE